MLVLWFQTLQIRLRHYKYCSVVLLISKLIEIKRSLRKRSCKAFMMFVNSLGTLLREVISYSLREVADSPVTLSTWSDQPARDRASIPIYIFKGERLVEVAEFEWCPKHLILVSHLNLVCIETYRNEILVG